MNKLPLIIVIMMLFFSCQQKKERETVDVLLLFGHSGFCFKDSLNHIYPSTYWRYKDSLKLEIDSSRFDIRQYFEYRKDSFVRIAVRRHEKETEYHSIMPEDTIGFEKVIHSALIKKNYKWRYNHFNPGWISEGWDYTLYYETSFHKKFFINYVPGELPHSLRRMHDYIVSVIMKENPVMSNEFEYHPITETFAKSRIKSILPLPVPVKTVKFNGSK